MIKQKLRELYEEYTPQFKEILENTRSFQMDVSGPLLMSPDKRYGLQRTRLLIVGQETNGWGYFSNDLEAGMKHYEKFALGDDVASETFRSVIEKVESLLGNAQGSSAWTNISKFDMDAGRPLGKVLTEVMTVDHLLVREIEILEPDLILFFTGPYFDSRIERVFPEIQFHAIPGFKTDQLAALHHTTFGATVLRTYHPNYLRRSRLENSVLEYVKKIVS